MELTNAFEVPVSDEEAFAVLLDISRVLPCFPGAELVNVIDAETFQCKVTMRLGPIALTFRGTAKIVESDPVSKHARITLRGSDEKGRGGADAVVQFQLHGAGERTNVDLHTTIHLTGMVAQYGRGSGIIQSVASELTRQFAGRLKEMLAKP